MNNTKFPTPEELDAERAALVTPYVEKTLAEIRAALTKNGSGTVVDIAAAPAGAREELTRILNASKWATEFGSDQREGSWVRVTRR